MPKLFRTTEGVILQKDWGGHMFVWSTQDVVAIGFAGVVIGTYVSGLLAMREDDKVSSRNEHQEKARQKNTARRIYNHLKTLPGYNTDDGFRVVYNSSEGDSMHSIRIAVSDFTGPRLLDIWIMDGSDSIDALRVKSYTRGGEITGRNIEESICRILEWIARDLRGAMTA